jgi:heterodisulfide reductase subunit A-like polyferredoxin
MYDTLIIGGGVAGLTVAKELGKRGEKVLLLDKWGNLGGRIYTHHEKG